MPLVRVTLRKGRSVEFFRQAGQAIHEALVEAANAPGEGLFQIWDEVDSERLVASSTYGGVNRSEPLVVEITLNAGRTPEVKQALYRKLVERLSELAGVRPDDVIVNLIEVPKENWSFGNGRATYIE